MSLLTNNQLDWIKTSLGADSVQSVLVLTGGTSAEMYKIAVRADGKSMEAVLRLYTDREWLQAEPDLALHEASAFTAVNDLPFHTPQLLAFDPSGTFCGCPAVLMTCLKGGVELFPADRSRWLRQLSEVLAAIHSLDPPPDFGWRYYPYYNSESLSVPEWSSCPDLWSRGIAAVRNGQHKGTQGFIHRDFHPVNVMWENGEISGVVDWVNACLGPKQMDLAHCRLNLALLYGVQEADDFLDGYQQLAPLSYEPFWDLKGLMEILPEPAVYRGWTEHGVSGLTDELMRVRADLYIQHIFR
ncbi:phosphotransferase family protein [Peribacillus sp. SCS-37]|uniref:phosphotransferase family protein n=1 Tax=Paraperibacillus esterisolvens TaxID=3115296 RepID=UPI00390685D6